MRIPRRGPNAGTLPDDARHAGARRLRGHVPGAPRGAELRRDAQPRLRRTGGGRPLLAFDRPALRLPRASRRTRGRRARRGAGTLPPRLGDPPCGRLRRRNGRNFRRASRRRGVALGAHPPFPPPPRRGRAPARARGRRGRCRRAKGPRRGARDGALRSRPRSEIRRALVPLRRRDAPALAGTLPGARAGRARGARRRRGRREPPGADVPLLRRVRGRRPRRAHGARFPGGGFARRHDRDAPRKPDRGLHARRRRLPRLSLEFAARPRRGAGADGRSAPAVPRRRRKARPRAGLPRRGARVRRLAAARREEARAPLPSPARRGGPGDPRRNGRAGRRARRLRGEDRVDLESCRFARSLDPRRPRRRAAPSHGFRLYGRLSALLPGRLSHRLLALSRTLGFAARLRAVGHLGARPRDRRGTARGDERLPGLLVRRRGRRRVRASRRNGSRQGWRGRARRGNDPA